MTSAKFPGVPKNKSGIYQITCTANGKVYIGSSMTCIVSRWVRHLKQLANNSHSNPNLQASWNKYGQPCFVFGVVEYCAGEECVVKEQRRIDECLSLGKQMFNARGAGPYGRHSEEAKARMSRVHKGKIFNEEWLAKIRGSVKATYDDPETGKEIREKISAALRGRKHTEETKRKISKGNKGKEKPPMTQETRDKIGRAHKGSVRTAEACQNISESLKGHATSDETKKKIADSLRGRKLTDAHKAAVSAGGKGRKQSAEHVAKRTASRLANLMDRQKQEQ